MDEVQTPSDEPLAIAYKRWRNKQSDYEVIVTEVHHRRGEHGWFTHVVVKGSKLSPDKRVTWPGKVFLRRFEPLGRKLRIRSRWERIRRG